MAARFVNRVAIVTGGTAGIGLATTAQLLKEGAKVVVTGLQKDAGLVSDAVKSEHGISFDQSNLHEITGNMGETEFCRHVVAETIQKYGQVDHLVNNAFSFNAKAMDANDDDWNLIMRVGPIAYSNMIQGVAKNLIDRDVKHGSIVNMSSISAHISQPNRWTYNSAKGAVDQLTKCTAHDLGEFGIRVNSISPAWVWTREVSLAAGGDREKWEPTWGDYHMLRRLSDPIEIAKPALFLLSEDASFITGTDLKVDGGYLSMGPEALGKNSNFAGSD